MPKLIKNLIFAPLPYSKWPPPPNFWITDIAFEELWADTAFAELWTDTVFESSPINTKYLKVTK